MMYEPMAVKECRNERELKDSYSKIHRKFFEHGVALRNQASEDKADFSRLKEHVEQQLKEMKELVETTQSYQAQIDKLRQIVFAKRASLSALRDVCDSMGAVDIYTFDFTRIINIVASVYNLNVSDIKGLSRCKREVNARRHVVHLLTKHRPDLSLPLIGKLLGGKDHTTVIHARNSWRQWEAKLMAQVIEVNARLGIDQPVEANAGSALNETIKTA